MSVKIHHGVRFRSASLLAVHRQLMDLRPAVHAFQDAAAAAWLARTAMRYVDRMALGTDVGLGGSSVLSKALDDLWQRKRQLERSGRRDHEVDWGLSVSVLPYRGRVYGLAFIEAPGLSELFHAQDWVEDFSWYDNADRPEKVSRAAWEARGRIWGGIVSQDPASRPSGCGLSVEIETPRAFPGVDEVLAAVEPQEVRARKLAVDHVVGSHLRRRREAFEGDEAEWSQVVVSIAFEAMKFARTEAGSEEVAAEAARVASLIPREVTRETLLS